MGYKILALVIIVIGAFFTVFQLHRTGNAFYTIIYVIFSVSYLVLVHAHATRKRHRH